MEGQTYSIIRAHRDRDGDWEVIVESGSIGKPRKEKQSN